MSFLGGSIGNIAGALGTGSIGRAVVALELDARKYQAGLAAAKGDTEASTTTMSKGFDKLKTIGIAAGALAAAALVKFGVDSVHAAIEAQEAQDKLANSIQNSTTVTADAIPIFQAQAQAIRDLTGVDDDLINGMQGFLVQMGLTQDQVTRLTPLVVDLSQKMGVSLDAAAKAVGKSVNGTAGGLQRMGIVVDKTKEKTDPYVATMQALSKVQGFAAEKAKAQPWILLGSAMDELKETVGRELLPALIDIIPKLTTLAKDITPLVADAFGAAADAAQPLVDTLDELLSVLPKTHSASGQAAEGTSLLTTAWHFMNEANPVPLLAKYNRAIFDHIPFVHHAADETHGLTQQVMDSRDAFARAQSGLDDLTASHKKAARAARDQKAAEDELAGGMLGLISSLQQLQEDQKTVTDLQAHGKRGTQDYKDAVFALLQDQDSLNSTLSDMAQKMKDAGASTGDVKAAVFALGRQAGLSKADVKLLFDSLNSDADKAKGKIDTLNGALRQLPSNQHVGITVDVDLGAVSYKNIANEVRNEFVRQSRNNAGSTGLPASPRQG